MLKLCIAANFAAAETSTAFSSPLSDDLNGFFIAILTSQILILP